jgi:proliferating cell nuclear antigen
MFTNDKISAQNLKDDNQILRVMTEHTGPFKTLIEVLKELLPEAILEFEEKNISDDEEDNPSDKKKKGGLRIMAIDSTRTVLIYLKLDWDNFTEYTCKRKKLTLGVNMTYFHKLIKSMEKDDHLTLYVNNDDINHLNIKIENPEKKSLTNFTMNLMDLDEQELSIPPTTFDARIVISSSEFHRYTREMYQIAEYVEIKCTNDQLIFTCKGDYASRETILRESENSINVQFSNNNEDVLIVQGIYELKHLVLFGKCTSLCNDIEIYMKNDYPLVIKYTVATLGRLLLCLTPIRKKADDEESDYSSEESDED